ncbi:MAG: DUF493 domain-containing protein [Cyclobacteriaceae bacterium]|nr:DUF493 domain-containing protein [Cyclobacteriaceae bacterium]
MSNEWESGLREKLDQHYAWPAVYIFKFIVPSETKDRVIALFPRHHVRQKESGKGKYTGLTIEMMMPSTDAVLDVYRLVRDIPGLIAL